LSNRYKKILRYFLLFLFVVFLITIRFVEEIGFDKKPDDRFIISKVIDGDTVELAGGDKLRLLSIDTPEKGSLFHDDAKQFLYELVLGKTAKIEYAKTRRDRYGRLLGYLYVDSIFVNKTILDNGLGYLYLFKDSELNRDETKSLLKAQQFAIDNKAGIWSIKKESEDYYINTEGSFRLHRPGCRSLSNLREGHYRKFEYREEAFKEGLSPCRNCQP
jgi:hypothetical protein